MFGVCWLDSVQNFTSAFYSWWLIWIVTSVYCWIAWIIILRREYIQKIFFLDKKFEIDSELRILQIIQYGQFLWVPLFVSNSCLMFGEVLPKWFNNVSFLFGWSQTFYDCFWGFVMYRKFKINKSFRIFENQSGL